MSLRPRLGAADARRALLEIADGSSPSEVATRYGVSTATISRWRSGKSRCDLVDQIQVPIALPPRSTHALTDIRPDERRASCSRCGPSAPIYLNPNTSKWLCKVKTPWVLRRKRFMAPGASPEIFAALLASQKGVCAICGQTNASGYRLAVDHCHSSGLIRGLLCSRCNTAIGLMRDDPALLAGAIAYIQSATERISA